MSPSSNTGDTANFGLPRFLIRPMIASDLRSVLAITRLVPEAPWWSEAHVAQIIAPAQNEKPRLRSGHFRTGWVSASADAVQGSTVYGFLVLQALRLAPVRAGEDAELECEIESIVVDPDRRRRGVGHALLQAALAWCREQQASVIRLEVRSQNTAAIALYQHAGFDAVGTRPAYYHSPMDDAILMQMQLHEPGTSRESSPSRRS